MTAPLQAHELTIFQLVPEAAPAGPAARLQVSENTLENDFVKVTVSERGVDILDQETGHTSSNVLEFEDEADAGDIWDYSPTWNPPAPCPGNDHAVVFAAGAVHLPHLPGPDVG